MSTYFKTLLTVGLALTLQGQLSHAQGCSDQCLFGEGSGEGTCELFDVETGTWSNRLDPFGGQLHNRARAYLPWLRNRLMPGNGVMSAIFTDETYSHVASYGGERDAAIWTGAYLAAESLRALSTGSPDAQQEAARLVSTLHQWWNIPGDRGYLARFAAPSSSTGPVKATLPAEDHEVHQGWLYDQILWDWRGNVSRDQYQGVLLGYGLAYEALSDERLRGQIRDDLVEFAEQLMERKLQRVELIIDDFKTGVEIELENVVYTTAEMVDGVPRLEIDSSTGEVTGRGILVFWPNPSQFVREIPGFGWVPDVYLPTQALQLGAAFSLALAVTDGVPEFAERRSLIAAYYEQHVEEWLAISERWTNRNRCGESYHGLNIAFMPMYSWTRVETDAARQQRLRAILADRMWPDVAQDKNVFFAFIYASQALGHNTASVVEDHVLQLQGFPVPPNRAVPVDLVGQYPMNPECPELSAVAVDVSQRVPASFMWERQPWKLVDPGVPNRLYGGVDFLIAYWMGRYYGFLGEDAPNSCLAWRESDFPPGPELHGFLEIPADNSFQSGIGLVSGWFCGASEVAIQIDNGRLIPVGYGTSRADTGPVCGSIDNGFGFPINYNALADGMHSIVAYADGQPFARNQFQVRTFGEEFARGLSAQVLVPDFPAAGAMVGLQWQEAQQTFSIVAASGTYLASPILQLNTARANLEIPQPASSQSGIGLVSGWHCDASRIELRFDGGPMVAAATGTERRDTEPVCGDADNGFGYLTNFNLLGDGPHWVEAYADGERFAAAEFLVETLGAEFISGISRTAEVPGFPTESLKTLLQWQPANQNFVISGIEYQ